MWEIEKSDSSSCKFHAHATNRFSKEFKMWLQLELKGKINKYLNYCYQTNQLAKCKFSCKLNSLNSATLLKPRIKYPLDKQKIHLRLYHK